MKIRNGFVSNSSSSSFIVAVAKVADEAKATAWLKTLKISEYDFKIETLSDIRKYEKEWFYSISKKGNKVVVYSFITQVVLNIENMKEDDKILWISISNGEGDCGRFSGCDENGEYQGEIDYDIDLDYFSQEQQDIFNGLCEKNGLVEVHKEYGAGRDE